MIDDVAERIGALGFYAEGTVRLASQATYLDPYDEEVTSGQDVIRLLVKQYGLVEQQLRALIPVTERELEDPVTADLLTGMLGVIEKDLWFLEAHLEGDDVKIPVRTQHFTADDRLAASVSQRVANQAALAK